MILDLGGEPLVYQSIQDPVHDVASGAVRTPSRKYAFNGVWSQYMLSEVDNLAIMPEDAHVVAGAEAFPCVPTANDKILRGTEVWAVVRISPVPGDPFLDFQVRR